MAPNPNVFVSSTFFDLIDVRSEVEQLLRGMGLTPRLSDSTGSDFAVPTAGNSIETCLSNVRTSGLVLVILSQRYGSTLDAFGYKGLSATHAEYQEAKKARIPVRVYVRDRLEGDYATWRRNSGSASVVYPWVQDPKDHGLFRLLEEHRKPFKRKKSLPSNWVTPFTSVTDIKKTLQRDLRIAVEQTWASLPAGRGSVSVPRLYPSRGREVP